MASGIALVNPSVHTVLIPYLRYIYQIHILLGLVFAVTLLTPFVRWIPKGKSIRRLDWFIPVCLGTVIVTTGVMIWLVTAFPTAWRSTAFTWHGRISYVLGARIIIHAFYKAWGYRPSDRGVNPQVQPERRMFLKWIGRGIAGAAVLSIVDPVSLLNRLFQNSSAQKGGTSLAPPPQFAEYYTVTTGYPHMDVDKYRLTIDGSYTESLRLTESYDPSVLLAYKLNGQPLRTEQGYPFRLVVPKMYGYKSIKWVSRVEFSDKPLNGYWEQRRYPSEAYIGTGI
jgi:hypothetical protein